MADSHAEEFRKNGRAKEFIDDDGRHFILIKFPDRSGLMLRKEKSDGELSTAEYIPEEVTKEAIAEVMDTESWNTQKMVNEFIKK